MGGPNDRILYVGLELPTTGPCTSLNRRALSLCSITTLNVSHTKTDKRITFMFANMSMIIKTLHRDLVGVLVK